MASEQYTKKMLDGWYCRSIASMQANEAVGGGASVPAPVVLGPPAPVAAGPAAAAAAAGAAAAAAAASAPAEPQRAREARKDYSSDSSSEPEPEPNYRAQYLALKKKLKYLIYENECFQDALRSSQKRLLKVSRDRSFLLDRLLQYEKGESTSTESEDTESSDDTDYHRADGKRKKFDGANQNMPPSANKGPGAIKRKRAVGPKKQANVNHPGNDRMLHQAMLAKAAPGLGFGLPASDGHMTPEEVERHLQSRQSYLELLPERAPPTVPTEMFSNDPSLDSESNDVLENSPNVEEWFD